MQGLVRTLARVNGYIAVAAGGVMLLAAVAVILLDVVMRAVSHPLGGTDELSGYAMAIASAWGASYALTERAHVRIELIRNKLVLRDGGCMDLLALAASRRRRWSLDGAGGGGFGLHPCQRLAREYRLGDAARMAANALVCGLAVVCHFGAAAARVGAGVYGTARLERR